MRRAWWTVWIKVAVLAVALFLGYCFAKGKVDGILSPYLTDQSPSETTESTNGALDDPETDSGSKSQQLIDQAVSFAEKIVGKKIDYENLIFDYANDYAHRMMDESDEERNAITDRLS